MARDRFVRADDGRLCLPTWRARSRSRGSVHGGRHRRARFFGRVRRRAGTDVIASLPLWRPRSGRLQQREHLASTRRCSSGSSRNPSLPKIRPTCFSTAASVTPSASAIPRFDLPSAISASTWRSRGVSAFERIVLAALADHQRHDLRIKRGPASLRPGGSHPRTDLEAPRSALEQVADSARVVADQVHRIGLIAELGQHRGLRRRHRWRLISIAARSPSSLWFGGICTSTIATSG